MLVMITGTHPLKSTKKVAEAFMKSLERPYPDLMDTENG